VLDLCASNKMTLLVENIQSVTAFNTKIRVSLPIGMQVISGSANLKYPINASPLSIGQPVLVNGTTDEWDLAKLSSTLAKGFIGTSDTAKNRMLITFRVITNCDYASGSFVSARALANIKCGDPIPIVPAFSNPQDIKGVTRPYYTLVKSWADSLLPCQKPMVIKSRVIFLGPGKSGVKDRVEIYLPNGVNRDTSFWNAVRNAPNKDSATASYINGATLLSWKMPAGIIPGDSMEFDVRVTGENSKLVCGPADIITRSVVIQPVVCISTNIPCDIKVITGSELANPIVDKGNIQILLPTISSKLISADTERVVISYKVKNLGKNILNASPIILRYHYDRNNSGKWDINDDWLASDTFLKILKKDSQFTVTKTFKIKAGMSCGLLAVIDSGACACMFGQKLFPVPALQNAGLDTAICSRQALKLGSFSVNAFKYLWNDPNSLDSIRVPKPSFIATNQTGKTESIQLILTTNRGFCTSKDTVIIGLYPLPSLSILTPDTSICEKRLVQLISVTNGGNGLNKYSWTPTTGLSTSVSPNTFAKPLVNTVYTLQVKDAKACTAKDSVKINVLPFPKAWFTWPITCQGNDVWIKDSSSISSGSIVLRVWKTPFYDTFGTSNFAVNLGVLSKMPVTLITESDIGCADSLTRMVDVKANPVAKFSIAYTCQKDSSRFINTSFVDSGFIKSQAWDFGDGKFSNLKSPIHLYNTNQDFTVSLTTKTQYGCVDTAYGIARVFPLPKAQFSATNPCEKDSLRYSNSSNLFGDTLLNWSWNFGIRGGSNIKNPTLLADTFGIYTSFLKVTSLHGCVDTHTLYSPVFALPKASFTNGDNCLGLNTLITNTSIIAQGNIIKNNWLAGNGFKTASQNLSYSYPIPGSFIPKLVVESDKGCRDSVLGNINIWPLAKPNFVGLSHCFKEQFAANANYWGGGIPAQWKWYLGTGDSLLTQNITYAYMSAGNYTVRLVLTTNKGCSKDSSAVIVVHALPVLTINTAVPCNDDSVLLNGNATVTNDNIQSYLWTFADNSKIPGKIARKIFAIPGMQKVNLIATTSFSCKDSIKTLVKTNPPVIIDFTANNVCLDELTQFTNLSISTEPITKYTWKFGDGRTSAVKDPVLTYKKAGFFSVDLTIETITGCTYTVSKSVTVHPKPIPSFDLNPKFGTIVNPNIAFTDLSSNADSIWYNLSTGYTTSQRNFSYTFPDSGNFTVWQVAKTNFDCYDSVSESLMVHFMYTLFVPNTFTPNADSKNESFGPGGMGISWYEMRIYTRWGELVYQTEDSKPWDGLIDGRPAIDGVYAVLINIRDYKKKRHTYEGTVTVLK
jgi:gliding motility-associated-like protein